MAYENLLVECDGPVCLLTIHRPKALNALNAALLEELRAALQWVRGQTSVRCLVLTGAGEKAFVAGADIEAMQGMTALEGLQFAQLGHSVMHGLETLSIPVIAAVNGFALGGGLELALACDLIIAAHSAKFGQPEINLGIIPGFGGTQRLSRRIGIGMARWMIYTGDMITAEQAQRLGLIDRSYERAELLPEARKQAAALAAKAPLALQQAKAALLAAADVAAGCRFEAEAFALTFASADRTEGMRAFLEKRAAQFSGK